jgi:rSAM/selenodomain-associated transferase 2
MKLSIIIPCLNEEDTLGKLLHFFTTAEHSKEQEIFVVDGGSNDKTIEIAVKYGAQVLKSSKANRAIQMNLGAQKATHEVLYFVHADTMPPGTYYGDIKNALDKGYEMGCYRSDLSSGGILLRVNSFFTRFHWLFCRGGDQSFFIPKELFISLGMYDESYQIMEEYDFIQRHWKKHKSIILPKGIKISTRKYEGKSWWKVNRANYFAVKNFKKGMPTDEIKRIYQRMLS